MGSWVSNGAGLGSGLHFGVLVLLLLLLVFQLFLAFSVGLEFFAKGVAVRKDALIQLWVSFFKVRHHSIEALSSGIFLRHLIVLLFVHRDDALYVFFLLGCLLSVS